MGLYDRDYTQADFHTGPSHRFMPNMRFHFPRLTPIVKKLIIINVVIYFIVILIPSLGNFIYNWFAVDTASKLQYFQIWRLVSYQFLHSPNYIWHIIFNMLGLYFLGPTLEKHWGSKKFLTFYLICGIAGGLFYMLTTAVGFLPSFPLVGASGSILGLLAACAILFPQFIVFLFIFPVPIRFAAIILTLYI
ncbi:rhomboid family intramembrane serine protease [Planctomycetota bacterium]